MKMKNNFEGRWNHVYRLWKLSLSSENLPQLDRWLAQEFAKNSKYGSRDRKWYSEILFSGMRFGYFALFLETLFKKANTPFTESTLLQEIKVFSEKMHTPAAVISAWKNLNVENFFLWVCLRYQKLETAENIVLDNEHSDEKIQFFEQLFSLFSTSTNLSLQLLYHSVPLWFEPYLRERQQISHWQGEQLAHFLANLDNRPPLWARANAEEHVGRIVDELTKESFSVAITEKNTLKIAGAKGVFATESFRHGLFEIQDLASQRIGEQVKARPGQFVWDCCAGGGGKTLQIASILKNKGAIYASDIRAYKLEELKKRARRAGFFNVRCLPWEEESLPSFPLEIQKNKGFDWVIVDAPCSSSGTWRRNPDAKMRILHENIENLSALQLKILNKAFQALKVGGTLVYSTCSWIANENEGVVEAFLQENKDVSLISQTLTGSPLENADTMFVATFHKKSIT